MNHSSIVKWKSEGRFKSKRVESFAKKDFHKQYEVGDFTKVVVMEGLAHEKANSISVLSWEIKVEVWKKIKVHLAFVVWYLNLLQFKLFTYCYILIVSIEPWLL